MEERDYIVRAQQLLIENRSCPQHALAAGATRFWSAVLYIEKWPADIQIHAQSILRGLFCQGTIQRTAMSMDDETANYMIEELLLFTEDFLRCHQESATCIPICETVEEDWLVEVFGNEVSDR